MEKEKFVEKLIEYYENEFGDLDNEPENYMNLDTFNLAYSTSEDGENEYQLDLDFEDEKLVWKINDIVVKTEFIEVDELFDWFTFDYLFEHCYERSDIYDE